MEWTKFLSTEWIVFVVLTGIGTYVYMETDKINFEYWAAFVGALAVNMGVIRTWKNTVKTKVRAKYNDYS